MPRNASRFIDTKALQALYTQQTSWAAIFDQLAARKNRASATKVETLQSIASRAQIVALFKALESNGCGVFVVGRKKHPSRFVWHVDVRDVGKAASGAAVEVVKFPENGEEGQDTQDQDDESSSSTPLLEHVYNLRAARPVRFVLPEDLTAAEADRLASFIKTLPLDR